MRRSIIPLATLVWSLAALVIVHGATISTNATPSPLALSDQSDVLRLAEQVLIRADQFESSSVGFAAVTPASVLAWHVILDSPHPDGAFRDVFSRAGTAGQLYALVALRRVDPQAYAQYFDDLHRRGGSVDVVRGCIGSRDPIAKILAEIDDDEWTRDLDGAH